MQKHIHQDLLPVDQTIEAIVNPREPVVSCPLFVATSYALAPSLVDKGSPQRPPSSTLCCRVQSVVTPKEQLTIAGFRLGSWSFVVSGEVKVNNSQNVMLHVSSETLR